MLKFDRICLPRDNFNLDLDVEIDNNVTGIFGHSGAGKTSLLHLLAGLAKPASGSIVFNGRELVNVEKKIFVPPHRRRFGLAFQEARLFPHMTVRKNLLFGQKYLPRDCKVPDFDDIVDLLELRHLLDSHPAFISGGEKQRAALGRALLSSPEMLLLDEPFSAVDIVLRKHIFPFLWKIRSSLDIPMLIISHDLPDILKLTDRLLLIDSGKVIGHDSIGSLVCESQAFNVLKHSGIVSVIDLVVDEIIGKDALVTAPGEDRSAFKVYASYVPDLEVGRKLKVSIAPEDVILSAEPIYNTSARNTIKGRVVRAIEAPGRSICQIDIGLGRVIYAEVTRESFHKLDIFRGAEIYCLIKANSVIISPI